MDDNSNQFVTKVVTPTLVKFQIKLKPKINDHTHSINLNNNYKVNEEQQNQQNQQNQSKLFISNCNYKKITKANLFVNQENAEYRECVVKKHHIHGSKHPRNKVPVLLFRKNPSDPRSLLLKTCLDCRKYQKNCNIRMQERRKKIAEDQKINNDFRFCPDTKHNTLSNSIYDRDKVPIVFFRKEPKDPRSLLFETCLDCRKYKANYNKHRISEKKKDAGKEGHFFCTHCHKKKTADQRAVNLDGTLSILCLICKEIEKTRSLNIRKWYNDIKLELIAKYQCSCQKCRCIYLKPLDDGYIPIRLQISEIDGKPHVDYNGQFYSVDFFLITYKYLLELRIIQLDHLPESEQRERGLLPTNQSYIKKKKNVSKLSSDDAMRLEALKCQNLCCKCHLEETILRESGITENSRSHLERQKLNYVNQLKIKQGGCIICKFWDPNLIRFFDMDHIDPKNKTKDLSRMIKDNQYTLNDVIKECDKCRILCKHCHWIHTHKQNETMRLARITNIIDRPSQDT